MQVHEISGITVDFIPWLGDVTTERALTTPTTAWIAARRCQGDALGPSRCVYHVRSRSAARDDVNGRWEMRHSATRTVRNLKGSALKFAGPFPIFLDAFCRPPNAQIVSPQNPWPVVLFSLGHLSVVATPPLHWAAAISYLNTPSPHSTTIRTRAAHLHRPALSSAPLSRRLQISCDPSPTSRTSLLQHHHHRHILFLLQYHQSR